MARKRIWAEYLFVWYRYDGHAFNLDGFLVVAAGRCRGRWVGDVVVRTTEPPAPRYGPDGALTREYKAWCREKARTMVRRWRHLRYGVGGRLQASDARLAQALADGVAGFVVLHVLRDSVHFHWIRRPIRLGSPPARLR
jgi:hypothetical protein